MPNGSSFESCNGNGSSGNWSTSRGLADHGHMKAASRVSEDPFGHAVSLFAGDAFVVSVGEELGLLGRREVRSRDGRHLVAPAAKCASC